MDLGTIRPVERAEDARELTLYDPNTREPLGQTLMVMGYDAEAVVQAGRAHARQVAARGKGRRDGAAVEDVVQERQAWLAAAAVADWCGATFAGKPITADNARTVLADPNMAWVARQITDFGGDLGNFGPRTTPA